MTILLIIACLITNGLCAYCSYQLGWAKCSLAHTEEEMRRKYGPDWREYLEGTQKEK